MESEWLGAVTGWKAVKKAAAFGFADVADNHLRRAADELGQVAFIVGGGDLAAKVETERNTGVLAVKTERRIIEAIAPESRRLAGVLVRIPRQHQRHDRRHDD